MIDSFFEMLFFLCQNQIVVYDISDPLSIVNMGKVNGSSNYLDGARSLFVSGGYLYAVSTVSDSFTVIDINTIHGGVAAGISSTFLYSFLLAITVEGYFKVAMSWADRSISFIGALFLIKPGAITDLFGLACLAGIVFLNRHKAKSRKC